MDGFCAYGVGSCYDCFVVFVIARYYLLTQGTVWEADMLPSPQGTVRKADALPSPPGTVTLRKADALPSPPADKKEQDLFYRPIVESIGKLQEITNKLPMPPTLLIPV